MGEEKRGRSSLRGGKPGCCCSLRRLRAPRTRVPRAALVSAKLAAGELQVAMLLHLRREPCCSITAVPVSLDCRLWPLQRLPAGQTSADLLRQPSLRIARNHQREAIQGPGGGLCLPALCGRMPCCLFAWTQGKALGVFPEERCVPLPVWFGVAGPLRPSAAWLLCGSHSGGDVVGLRGWSWSCPPLGSC